MKNVKVYKVNLSNGQINYKDTASKSITDEIKILMDHNEEFISVIPLQYESSSDECLLFTKTDTPFLEVEFYEASTEKHLFTIENENIHELLNIVKNVDEFEFNDRETFYRGKYIKSKFQINDEDFDKCQKLLIYMDTINIEL